MQHSVLFSKALCGLCREGLGSLKRNSEEVKFEAVYKSSRHRPRKYLPLKPTMSRDEKNILSHELLPI